MGGPRLGGTLLCQGLNAAVATAPDVVLIKQPSSSACFIVAFMAVPPRPPMHPPHPQAAQENKAELNEEFFAALRTLLQSQAVRCCHAAYQSLPRLPCLLSLRTLLRF